MSSLAALENRRGQLIDQIATVTAAISGAQRQLARLQQDRQFARSEQQRTAIDGQIASLRTEIARDNAELQRLNSELAQIDAELARLRTQDRRPVDSAGQETVQAQTARDEGANAVTPPTPPATVPPPTNADQFDPGDQDVTDNALRRGSVLQSTPPVTARPGGIPPGSPSGRVDGSLVADTGTAPRPGPGFATDPAPGETAQGAGSPQPVPTNANGASAPNDDARALTSFINQTFGGAEQQIKAQSNVLSQFASYTYNVSVYIMSPAEYIKMIRTKQRNIAGYQLLLQSGGAGAQGQLVKGEDIDVNIELPSQAGAVRVQNLGRNEFFNLDYYIDDLKINHLIAGKGTGGAHTATNMTFKIIEPNGITFLDNLYKATQQYVAIKGGRGNQNYAAQNFLMIIRFYGYDDQGRLISNQRLNVKDPISGTITSQATVEKFIPFQFTAIKFRVANRLTEYECEAVCPQNNVATGPARGVVPYNIELQGQTLKNLLTGSANFATTAQAGQVAGAGSGRTAQASGQLPPVGADPDFENRLYGAGTTPGTFGTTEELNQALGLGGSTVQAGSSPTQNRAPPKANSAPTRTLVGGLATALNDYQQELVKAGRQQWPDQYEIVIVSEPLQNAKLAPPGEVNLRQTPMVKAQDPAQSKLGAKQSVANSVKTNKILAGQSIVQVLDQVVRSSSYIYNQQLKIIDSKTGQTITNANPASTVAWFRIGLQAVPQGDNFYDNIRNDFAYKITYQISPYAVSDVKSEWFPRSRFRGTHKRYDYWFTGRNSEILDLVQDYNYLFYIVQSAPQAKPRNLFNTRELERAFFAPNSNATNQGVDKNTNEPQANATDYLYSPADQSRIRMKIVGDPAWIQQGELSNGIQGQNFNYRPFLDDGTISYESQDILFEVNFNAAVDYDLSVGTMDPGSKNFDRRSDSQGRPTAAGDARQSFVYQAVRCTSVFARGRFEQELEGVLRTWPNPTQVTATQQSDRTETARTAQGTQATNRTPQIDVPTASSGSFELETGVANGPVNYRPTSLATVLDSQRPTRSLATSSLAAEGFDNQALGLSEAEPATSGGQVVGTPNQSAAETNRLLGTARGPGVGAPSATLYLNNGQAVEVQNQSQINTYRQGGFASPQAASAATSRLNLAQQAANNPTSSAPVQRVKKEF